MGQSLENSCIHLVLGGARSGKSGYAEQLAKDSQLNVLYLATAKAFDAEMAKRIAKHQADRPSHWQTQEVTSELAQTIDQCRGENQLVLVDCLTLWLMDVMESKRGLDQAVDELLMTLQRAQVPVILVSNEISMGVVPMGELSRSYVDNLGRLHQKIAQIAENVTLMVAGIPMVVKA
ncbi:bifunctional adenosylcobinamide kinase/adenosylcobinamide-phosphate guanylyltransferase [Oceaniserpentilla sp. 4NH20-0058]|uniref:bifunctional adenosylcobinamide kinase/adenosylcobinamide-phosphate guanylyltransferase n=1 Tax=Oceaniserpentilla sp. 4NH20-0058 TaxID=3127660 RepID=UPI00310571C6